MSSGLDALRKQYAKALLANQKAQSHLAELVAKHQENDKHIVTEAPEVLPSHLKVAQLRKKHQRLQVLEYYLEKTDIVSREDQLFEPQPDHWQPHASRHLQTNDQISTLLKEFDILVHKLEIAVLQARYQLKNEQSHLEKLRVDAEQSRTAVLPGTRLRALSVTRGKLTQWIEQSLERCDAGNGITQASYVEVTQKPADLVRMIEQNYESYLTARERLLDAAHNLTKPISISPSNLVQPVDRAGQSTASNPPDSTLSSIESQHLQLVIQRRYLKQYQEHLSHQIAQAKTKELEQLYRLSDESHLLPSYPILAHSEKFKHASAAFKPPEQQGALDQASRLLQAWTFAAEAAEISLTEAVLKHCRQGNIAVQETQETIEAMQYTQDSWKHL